MVDLIRKSEYVFEIEKVIWSSDYNVLGLIPLNQLTYSVLSVVPQNGIVWMNFEQKRNVGREPIHSPLAE